MPKPGKNKAMAKEAKVNSLARGLKILEVFSAKGFGLTLAEVAGEMELAKSTTHRLLATLCSLGYLNQPIKGGAYYLAPAVLGLGFAALKGLDVRQAAVPCLEALFGSLGENVNLSLLDREEIIYVVRFQKRAVLSLNLQVGSRLPVYNSSPGRVLAAFLPEEEREELIGRVSRLPEYAAWSAHHGQGLRELLAQVRREGFSANDGEYMPELFALAAPVLGPGGRPLAAVSTAMLKGSRSGAELLELTRQPVLTCAAKISALMGHGQGD